MRRISRKRDGVVQMRDLRQATPGLSGLQTREQNLQGSQKTLSDARRERLAWKKEDRKELRRLKRYVRNQRVYTVPKDMRCEDCPYAMACYAGKLDKMVATKIGVVKLCTQCGRTIITHHNGKTTRFKCELRVVTPELRQYHLRNSNQYYMPGPPSEPAPMNINDPGPAGGFIELITCPHCHLNNVRTNTDAQTTSTTYETYVLDVVHTDGTSETKPFVITPDDDDFTT
jgi:hypothetical protein